MNGLNIFAQHNGYTVTGIGYFQSGRFSICPPLVTRLGLFKSGNGPSHCRDSVGMVDLRAGPQTQDADGRSIGISLVGSPVVCGGQLPFRHYVLI